MPLRHNAILKHGYHTLSRLENLIIGGWRYELYYIKKGLSELNCSPKSGPKTAYFFCGQNQATMKTME